MRKRAKELVGDDLVAERVPFTFTLKEGGGEEVRPAPYVYIECLWEKIQSMLDQNER